MRAAFGLLLLPFAGGFSPLGCSSTSGQTGSPSCASVVSCVCAPLNGGAMPLRVRVERFDSSGLEAVVVQPFSSTVAPWIDIVQGDRVGGPFTAEWPCDPEGSDNTGAVAVPPNIQEGTELLVAYRPGNAGNYPNCSEFHACANADCSGLEGQALSDCWNRCETSTAQICADLRGMALMQGSFSWAVPWQDPLDFGDSSQLSTGEIEVLASPEDCLARFPAPPPPPCDDTQTRTSMQCAAAPPNGSSSAAWLLISAGLTLIGVLRRGLPTLLARRVSRLRER